MFVTTSRNTHRTYVEQAKWMSSLLGILYKARKGKSVLQLLSLSHKQVFMVWTKEGPKLVTSEADSHAFHLSMAQLRIKQLEKGKTDHLVEIVRHICPSEDATLLDCTLGLGSDSIVLSYAFGSSLRVVGLEENPYLAFITNHGLRHFIHEKKKVTEALRRIQVIAIDYETYLPLQQDNSYDVIYFDPMFQDPVMESSQFGPLRSILSKEEFQLSIIEEALRVAKKGVIIKNRAHSALFKNPIFHNIYGGTYSSIAYGVIIKD